jgi:hypothetical protein
MLIEENMTVRTPPTSWEVADAAAENPIKSVTDRESVAEEKPVRVTTTC